MSSRGALTIASWLFVVASSGAVLDAQFTSSIEGTVTDQSGAVFPRATLTLVNNDTGIRSALIASDAGYFRFPALAAARFTLTVTAPGFRTVTMSDVRLEVGERRTLNITLEVSAEVATVTVTATPAAVELSEARVSGAVRWQLAQHGPGTARGGTLATAGGLVFFCDDQDRFIAVDASSGAPLWRFQTNNVWRASPMTYQFDGAQFVAIASGSNIIVFGLAD